MPITSILVNISSILTEAAYFIAKVNSIREPIIIVEEAANKTNCAICEFAILAINATAKTNAKNIPVTIKVDFISILL